MVHVRWSVTKIDLSSCMHRTPHLLWHTKDGEDVYICKMTDTHLGSTIALIERNIESGFYIRQQEALDWRMAQLWGAGSNNFDEVPDFNSGTELEERAEEDLEQMIREQDRRRRARKPTKLAGP